MSEDLASPQPPTEPSPSGAGEADVSEDPVSTQPSAKPVKSKRGRNRSLKGLQPPTTPPPTEANKRPECPGGDIDCPSDRMCVNTKCWTREEGYYLRQRTNFGSNKPEDWIDSNLPPHLQSQPSGAGEGDLSEDPASTQPQTEPSPKPVKAKRGRNRSLKGLQPPPTSPPEANKRPECPGGQVDCPSDRYCVNTKCWTRAEGYYLRKHFGSKFEEYIDSNLPANLRPKTQAIKRPKKRTRNKTFKPSEFGSSSIECQNNSQCEVGTSCIQNKCSAKEVAVNPEQPNPGPANPEQPAIQPTHPAQPVEETTFNFEYATS